MDGTIIGDTVRSDRILAEKLRLLYRGNFAVPANFVIACVAAFALKSSFPALFLAAWLAANAIVVVLRILLYRRFLRADLTSRCSVCWARAFCIGSLASGVLWAAVCLGLPVWGHENQYVALTLVIAGISAAALTTIVTYLPAYFSYAAPMIVSLATALLFHPDPAISVTGWLMLLFLAILGLAAKNLSRAAVRSIELNIDNEALNESLKRARIERDAARTDKWSTLSQLSHELRTPLNAILGFSEALYREYFGPLGNARYKDYASHVVDSGRHVLALINEILELSQGEAGQIELNEGTVDPDGVVGACLKAMAPAAEQAQLTLTASTAAGLPLLRADETKLHRMLLTLVSNAIKFTPPGGAVCIGLSTRPDGGVDLAVRDNGIGMRAEDIPLALQPFGRLASPAMHKNEGMGLGLTVCKRLAELHGARLIVDSELGVGTTCTIAFPAGRSMFGAVPRQVAAA